MRLNLQPAQLASGNADTEAQLEFVNDGLIAVLVHLSEDHDDEAGMWFLETWFGPTYKSNQPTFAKLNEAQDWIVGQCAKV